jgi:hypothetical protein
MANAGVGTRVDHAVAALATNESQRSIPDSNRPRAMIRSSGTSRNASRMKAAKRPTTIQPAAQSTRPAEPNSSASKPATSAIDWTTGRR